MPQEPSSAGRCEAVARRRAKGHGIGTMPTDEALATVVLEVSDRPLVASNVDLAPSHVGGLETDLADASSERSPRQPGLTIHVRLVEGEDRAMSSTPSSRLSAWRSPTPAPSTETEERHVERPSYEPKPLPRRSRARLTTRRSVPATSSSWPDSSASSRATRAVEGDIAQQTEQVMRNLAAILDAAGSSLDRVLKTTVFLQRLDDFAA